MQRQIKLGNYVRLVMHGANWPDNDDYPTHQARADDNERLFIWADHRGIFDRLLSRLRARPRERDAAISEIRSARFLESRGARMVSWEPAETNRPGEFEVQWPASLPIFVEVKGPTWESELTEKGEALKLRKQQPRFTGVQGRWSTSRTTCVRYAARKTMGKLNRDRPNLLVVADHLFVSPVKDLERQDIEALLAVSRFDGLSGILCLDANWVTDDGRTIDVRTLFATNPRAAGKTWELPGVAAAALFALNPTDK
jgi:hypothetical protein